MLTGASPLTIRETTGFEILDLGQTYPAKEDRIN